MFPCPSRGCSSSAAGDKHGTAGLTPPRHRPHAPPITSPSPCSRCAAPCGRRHPDPRLPSGPAGRRSHQNGSAWGRRTQAERCLPCHRGPSPTTGSPPPHLDGRCSARTLLSASSRCRRASSSCVSPPCSAAACPWPSAASSSGLCGQCRQCYRGALGGSPTPHCCSPGHGT